MPSEIQRALERVRERIAEACLRSNRSPSDVTLIAVSKTFPAEVVIEAIVAGQRDFGENRVEEALEKIASVQRHLADSRLLPRSPFRSTSRDPRPDSRNEKRDRGERGSGSGTTPDYPVNWHLIGHVQSRKVRDAAGGFDLIHSVDSFKLASRLNAVCDADGRTQDILLECNVSGEASKEGFSLAGWEQDRVIFDAFARVVEQIVALPNLRVRGLMTLAPIVEQAEEARPIFASLRGLGDALLERFPNTSWDHLSMGMTDDFEAAIAEGATMVRIGRAIFGARV